LLGAKYQHPERTKAQVKVGYQWQDIHDQARHSSSSSSSSSSSRFEDDDEGEDEGEKSLQ
jgi:hypothetical protein